MIEIIPNTHPIYVKFAVALVVLVGLLQLALWFIPKASQQRGLVEGMPWLVGTGVVAVVATIISGLIAYYTVPHDGPSHVLMSNHKYWGILLAVVFLSAAALYFKARSAAARGRDDNLVGLVAGGLFAASLLVVIITASQGAHLVFGHGIGVQSLPEVTGDGHDHHH